MRQEALHIRCYDPFTERKNCKGTQPGSSNRKGARRLPDTCVWQGHCMRPVAKPEGHEAQAPSGLADLGMEEQQGAGVAHWGHTHKPSLAHLQISNSPRPTRTAPTVMQPTEKRIF